MKNHFNKITIAISTTAILLFSSIAFAAFDDVFTGHPNHDAISYVHDKGIVEGYEDFTYKPDNTINRAEFTKILVGSIYDDEIDNIDQCYKTYEQGLDTCAGDGECGLPVWEGLAKCVFNKDATNISAEEYDKLIKYDECFPDVSHDVWYGKYVCLAKMSSVIEGYPDGSFKPADEINFVEAAKIIAISYNFPVGEDTVWYKPYVDALATGNAIPTTITSFDHKITRGEMAEMVYRILEEIENKDYTDYATLAGEGNNYSSYEDWIIPTDMLSHNLEEQTENDCVSVIAGWTYGGDLLSTMIASEDGRALMDLDVYTPEYVKGLENAIVAKTQSEYNSDFYAFHACHLFNDVDVVSGYLYPQGESPKTGSNAEYETADLSYDDTLLAIVSGDDILLFDDIKVIGNTATGGEPPLCAGEMQMNSVLWACFMGLNIDTSANETDGLKMKYWSIPLDGSEPTVWEDIEYLE